MKVEVIVIIDDSFINEFIEKATEIGIRSVTIVD